MAGLVRHRQTKGSATDRLHLHHRATPRLHTCVLPWRVRFHSVLSQTKLQQSRPCFQQRAGPQAVGVGPWSRLKPNVRLRLAAGTREVPEPGKQCRELRRVLLCHGCEFESQSVTGLNMPHGRLGPDLAFLDKKIEPGFRAHRRWTWGSNKQASRAQVQDAGNFILAITTPIDPDTIVRFDARGMSPRVGRCLRRG